MLRSVFCFAFQGHLHVASVFGGKDSLQLKGPEVLNELRLLVRLLTFCWHFSKKPFPLFLEETGFSQEDVLLQEPKAGVSYDLESIEFCIGLVTSAEYMCAFECF